MTDQARLPRSYAWSTMRALIEYVAPPDRHPS